MKVLHLALAALFLYIAALQLNDPDPLYWLVVYVGTAAVALAKGLGHHNEFLTAVLIGAVAAGMIIATPALVEFLQAGDLAAINDMGKATYIEPTREFGGLLLALLALIYYVKR